jgi:hypothetical protein
MKKIILHIFICAACFAVITGCSKDVKAPSSQPKNTTVNKATSPSSTQTQTPGENHNSGCGNHNSSNGGSDYYAH